MNRILEMICLAVICLALLYNAGADVPPATYMATEIQQLRLQVAQDKVVIANQQLQVAQQNFQQALNALNAQGEQVKKENKWPDGVIFNGFGSVPGQVNPPSFSAPPTNKEPEKKP